MALNAAETWTLRLYGKIKLGASQSLLLLWFSHTFSISAFFLDGTSSLVGVLLLLSLFSFWSFELLAYRDIAFFKIDD